MVFNILALDGGGVRAVLESTILSRLLVSNPNLLDEVDLYAGTSAGGILALCFASGLGMEATAQFYANDVNEIFKRTLLSEFESLDGSISAKYDNTALRTALKKQFGDLKMKDLKRKVLITSFQLDNTSDPHVPLPTGAPRRWIPRFFHNLDNSTCGDELVVDIALRTSAAPTYFPIYQNYIDGGVFANNPSMCAVTTAIAAGIPLQDIVTLSISTGRDGDFLSKEQCGTGDWGLVQWAPKLVDLLLDAGPEVIDFQSRQLLGERYHRVDPGLPKKISLDEPKEMPLLVQIGHNVDLTPTEKWIKDWWCRDDGHQSTTAVPPTVPNSAQPTRLLRGVSGYYSSYCTIM